MLRIDRPLLLLRDAGVALPPLCRPAGWVTQWRRIGILSVLNWQVQPVS